MSSQHSVRIRPDLSTLADPAVVTADFVRRFPDMAARLDRLAIISFPTLRWPAGHVRRRTQIGNLMRELQVLNRLDGNRFR